MSLTRFVKEWARLLYTGILLGGGTLAALSAAVMTLFAPIYVGMYVDYGLMPWQLGAATTGGLSSIWVGILLPWLVFVFSGAIAADNTFGLTPFGQEVEDRSEVKSQ